MKGSKTVNWSISVETVMHSSQWIFRVFKVQYHTCLLSSVLLNFVFVYLLQSEGWPVILSQLFFLVEGGGEVTVKPLYERPSSWEVSLLWQGQKEESKHHLCERDWCRCCSFFCCPAPSSSPTPPTRLNRLCPTSIFGHPTFLLRQRIQELLFLRLSLSSSGFYSVKAAAPISMSLLLDTLVCGCLVKGIGEDSCLCCCFFLGTWTSFVDFIILCFYSHVAHFIV